MATTRITIEFIDATNIKVTINDESFQGFYGKPLRKQTAIKAIEQAHFDEIFDVRVVSKGDTEREQAELENFKETLHNRIRNSYNAQNYLNLMVKREPQEKNYQFSTKLRQSLLDHSKKAQLNILKEAKIMADKKEANGKISEKDRKNAAKHSSPSELLKAKASIEAQKAAIKSDAQREQREIVEGLEGIGSAISIASLFMGAIMMPALIALPALTLILAGALLAGLTLLLSGFIIGSNSEPSTHSVELLNKLKRLDPNFLDKLEAELPVGPEPAPVVAANIQANIPASPLPPEPVAPADDLAIGPDENDENEVGPDENRGEPNINRPNV